MRQVTRFGFRTSNHLKPQTLNLKPYFCPDLQTNNMETSTVSLIIAVIAFFLAVASLLKKPPVLEAPATGMQPGAQLKLQAYERLVLLTERIALPNLITRLAQPGISAFEMKVILTENIKQEFEYNSTQQLYVSSISWDAVRNLKEQNIMIVNKMAEILPADASGADLNKKIIELMMAQPGGSLHEMVLEALNFEAKKLIQ